MPVILTLPSHKGLSIASLSPSAEQAAHPLGHHDHKTQVDDDLVGAGDARPMFLGGREEVGSTE